MGVSQATTVKLTFIMSFKEGAFITWACFEVIIRNVLISLKFIKKTFWMYEWMKYPVQTTKKIWIDANCPSIQITHVVYSHWVCTSWYSLLVINNIDAIFFLDPRAVAKSFYPCEHRKCVFSLKTFFSPRHYWNHKLKISKIFFI